MTTRPEPTCQCGCPLSAHERSEHSTSKHGRCNGCVSLRDDTDPNLERYGALKYACWEFSKSLPPLPPEACAIPPWYWTLSPRAGVQTPRVREVVVDEAESKRIRELMQLTEVTLGAGRQM